MEKSVLYQVPQAIKFPVIAALNLAVLFGRDDNLAARLNCLVYNLIAVIPAICQQKLGSNAVNQSGGMCAICCGTRCNNNSDRHTMRIHGQMYFTVEPPFVRPIPWLPPLAPTAWGWTLQ